MFTASQTFSIIIFCYNEVDTVSAVIDSAFNFIETINSSNSEVIVVNDGSLDGSEKSIDQSKQKYPQLKLITHPENKGIGEALRSGYFNATKENVVAVPADGQFDLKEMIPFATVPAKTFISFFRKENTVYSIRRNFLSLLNKKVNQYLLGITLKDVNWVKIYKLNEVKAVHPKIHSSLIESEICSKLLLSGNTVIETSSVYHSRMAGVSKGASLKIVLKALRDILKLVAVITLFRFRKV